MLGSLINSIELGDNLSLLNSLEAESLNLIYIDPPYNTGVVQRDREGEYLDIWPTMDAYVEYMEARVRVMYRVLKPHGSLLFHCDWRTSHHVRFLLERIFGADNFVNHLIWKYGLGGSSEKRFARKHDDILFFAKGSEYYFEPPQVPATSRRMNGQMKKCTDVLDIPSINNMAAERTGYPTQKPLALLSLLVEACCPPNGVVGDFFCGSGTTLVAAARSGRRWIGCDISQHAVEISCRRLSRLSSSELVDPGARED